MSELFDSDLPIGHCNTTLDHYIGNTKSWFEGWQGTGSLRNKAREDQLKKRWGLFLEVYTLTGDVHKDFLAFIQWDNESHWRDYVKNEMNNNNEGFLSSYFIQHNIKLQDAFERISGASEAHDQQVRDQVLEELWNFCLINGAEEHGDLIGLPKDPFFPLKLLKKIAELKGDVRK